MLEILGVLFVHNDIVLNLRRCPVNSVRKAFEVPGSEKPLEHKDERGKCERQSASDGRLPHVLLRG